MCFSHFLVFGQRDVDDDCYRAPSPLLLKEICVSFVFCLQHPTFTSSRAGCESSMRTADKQRKSEWEREDQLRKLQCVCCEKSMKLEWNTVFLQVCETRFHRYFYYVFFSSFFSVGIWILNSLDLYEMEFQFFISLFFFVNFCVEAFSLSFFLYFNVSQ